MLSPARKWEDRLNGEKFACSEFVAEPTERSQMEAKDQTLQHPWLYQDVPAVVHFTGPSFLSCMALFALLLLCCLVIQSCLTLRDPMDYIPPGFSVHGDSPDKNTGVGCPALLQGILPTQGLNQDWTLLHGDRSHWATREAFCSVTLLPPRVPGYKPVTPTERGQEPVSLFCSQGLLVIRDTQWSSLWEMSVLMLKGAVSPAPRDSLQPHWASLFPV